MTEPMEMDEHRSATWLEVLVLLAISGVIAVVIVGVSTPTTPRVGSTHAAVLKAATSPAMACDEGVVTTGSAHWVNDNEALDRMHLPIRGHIRIVDRSQAVFTARDLRVKLSTAMPCTAG